MKRHALIFGVVGGLLIAVLQWVEYRFLVIEHSGEVYGALIAVVFAGFGIWLGTRQRGGANQEPQVAEEEREGGGGPGFSVNRQQQQGLGITARELEILTLVARGLSNREIGEALFVSENTVKTHCARVFDKVGAVRRTQAVQRGKELGLLP